MAPETALRLARFFGTSPLFWLGLQRDYDLDVAADALGDRLLREVRVMEKREICYNNSKALRA